MRAAHRVARVVAMVSVAVGCVVFVSTASAKYTTTASTASSSNVSITASPAFTSSDLAATPDANWITDGGSVSNDRYSDLNQVNASNVSGLAVAWQAHLNGSGVAAKFSAEGTPIVYDGVMYISTGEDDVFALDATSGQQLWEYQSNIDQTINTACCGWDNRGVALGGGLVYDAQLDGNLVALDQMTGGIAWKVPVFNWHEGVTLTSAPLYYNGVVYVGSTGGEFGFRGSVTAYNATNGYELWRYFTVPEPGDLGGQTWAPGINGYGTGGGTVWNTPSVDPAQNEIVFTTGNAAPWFGRGPGENLMTSSFVSLNATTGQVAWYFQVVHHDIWDYDCPSPTVQFNITINGVMRQGIAEPCKTGWVYELDRTNGTPLVGINETKVPQLKDANTWPTQPVPVGQPFSQQCAVKKNFTGKSGKLAGKPVTAGCLFQPYDTTHAAAFAPTAQGGSDWNPSSFNPSTGDLYVCDADSDQSELGIPATTTASSYLAGKGDTGIDFGKFEFYDGHVTAMNMTNNTIAWAVKWPVPCYSGTFTTAGNLVFAGQPDGEYDAYNAQTGAKLWSSTMAAGDAAPGMTYSVNGKQYIAVYAGGSSFSFEGASISDPKGTFTHGDSVYAYALP